LDKFFKIKESGSNVRTEIMAGITTFFTMAYIIFVNPDILSEVITGVGADGTPVPLWNGVFMATIIATVIGTLIMGLVANVPYAVAPGMGLNAFFTYTVCMGLKFQWQEAMAMVFICGIINILITVTKVRKSIIKSIPRSLQLAIGGAIGLFIAYIGVKNAGFLKFTSDVTIAPDAFKLPLESGGELMPGYVTAGAPIVPGLENFNMGSLIALAGLIIIVVLLLLKVKGAMLIGIIGATVIAVITELIFKPGIVNLPATAADLFAFKGGEVKDVAFSFFGSPGLGSLFSDPSKILPSILIIFAFSLSDTFDTIGTFIGTGRKTGIFDEADEKALEESSGFKSKMDKALFADSVATSIGALFGTSNTTTYIESAAGINVGGRTGLTSVVTAVLFILCIPFMSLFGIVPAQATAPALIVVGVLMAESFAGIKWDELEESIPAFLTVIIMTFAYNISYGIAAGFVFYCIIKLIKGKAKEVHPILYIATFLFVLNFVVLALGII